MMNPKQHPLEIFRARGGHGPLVRKGGAAEGADPASTGTDAHHPRWEPQPFEMRLSLLGALVLALAWIVLLAAAYTLGLHRGRESSLAQTDARAKEQGQLIERGTTDEPPESGSRIESSNESSLGSSMVPKRPYGVLVLTYSKGTDNVAQRVGELKQAFAQKYQIAADQVVAWPLKSGESVVYVGVFDSREDPALQQLGAKLRQIGDWPYGKDKSPFKDARISQHPNDPRKFEKPSGGSPQNPK